MDTNTLGVTERVDLEQIDALDQKLQINVWALTKLSLEFNVVHLKLMNMFSYGNEKFLQKFCLFINRTYFLADLKQLLESLKKHPMHDDIRLADGLVRMFGLAGVHMEDMPQVEYQAPDAFPSNAAFTDEIDHIINNAYLCIDKMAIYAESVRDQLLEVRDKLARSAETRALAGVVD